MIIALHDALHLVPFDALPIEGGRVLGDKMKISVRATLKELAVTMDTPPGKASLLALGGIEYDSKPGTSSDEGGPSSTAVRARSVSKSHASLITAMRGAPVHVLRTSGAGDGFTDLPYTAVETDAIAGYFRKAFPTGPPPRVLKGSEASREAFERHSLGSRFVHLATHGYFAPESVPSMRDDQAVEGSAAGGMHSSDLRSRVRGFAPMVLCGLAFAGANAAAGDLGYARE